MPTFKHSSLLDSECIVSVYSCELNNKTKNNTCATASRPIHFIYVMGITKDPWHNSRQISLNSELSHLTKKFPYLFSPVQPTN